MTLPTAFRLVFAAAEANANGNEHCAKILEAIRKCREALKLTKGKKK